MNKIVIIDGHNLLFRAFFAVPPLSTQNGQPTNAVYGCLKTFKATIEDLKPDYVIICYDSGKRTARHVQDPVYKAHRPPTHDDLKSQFSLVKDVFARLGIPQITAPDDTEGDDLIGTIAVMADKIDFEAIIVSSDKDFFQLCNDKIKVYSFAVKKKNNIGIVDTAYVRENFGVNPNQLVDVKSLTGEKGDGITGVAGYGPKTATKLIQQHGTIAKVLKYLAINPEDRHAGLLNERDVISNAYSLALINTNVELPNDTPIHHVSKIAVNEPALREFFDYYELKSLNVSQWVNLFGYAKKVSA